MISEAVQPKEDTQAESSGRERSTSRWKGKREVKNCRERESDQLFRRCTHVRDSPLSCRPSTDSHLTGEDRCIPQMTILLSRTPLSQLLSFFSQPKISFPSNNRHVYNANIPFTSSFLFTRNNDERLAFDTDESRHLPASAFLVLATPVERE